MTDDNLLPILPVSAAPLPPAWEALFEAIEDGVCVQTPDGRIVRANRAFAEMFGLTQEQISGQSCAAVFGCANELGELPHFCARLASTQSGHAESEELYGRQPGQRLRARVSPLRDEAGQLTAYVMVVRDITDVVAREREQARVEQLARFGELAAGLAHEIKNPLAGIQGVVDILIQRRDANDSERTALEGVRREVGRINDTVQLLLARARPRPLNRRPASVTETVLRAVNLARASLNPAHKQQIRIEFQAPAVPLILLIDAAQLEDALLNLMLNAIDAIDALGSAGCIKVQLSENDLTDEIVIAVSDTGRGIPAEDLQRIFSPFYTTQANGTGLGLPAVKRIARAHGGQIKVASTVGTGSTFSLHFPRAS